MDDLDARIQGSVSFDRDVRFHGKVEGDLTVLDGRILELHGRVARDLIVEEGSSAIVYGLVGRNVVNKGGAVFVNANQQTLRSAIGRRRRRSTAANRDRENANSARKDGYGRRRVPGTRTAAEGAR